MFFSRGVNPGEEVVESVQFTPKYEGSFELIACFNSRQLTNLTGVLPVNITKQ